MFPAPSRRNPAVIAIMVSLLAVFVASLLILRADRAYNQTMDESAHIACGMEWLTHGTYTYETLHPPLARVATALLPYLAGIRSLDRAFPYQEGTDILNTGGGYAYNLLLARLGMLPFFWLSCLLVFRFTRRHFSAAHAAVAVILFAFCPTVLAISALAITDAPLMALFFASVISIAACLGRPTLRSGALASLCLGLAVLSKFTELPFLAVTLLLLVAQQWFTAGPVRRPFRSLLPPLRRLLLIILCAAPVVWAGYRFSFAPLFTPGTTSPQAQKKIDALSPHVRALVTTVKVPAPEFFRGLYLAHQETSLSTLPRIGFLLGHRYLGGRWDYFPVAILTKTPIATLLLAGVGLWACLFVLRPRLSKPTSIVLAGVLGPLIVGMLGDVNIGLRHILPIAPFGAVLASIGAMHLWSRTTSHPYALRGITPLLVAWPVLACLIASPEFLPYFNEPAAPFAGHILVDSNLDWGQDLYALEDRLKNVPPGDVWLHYNGDRTILRHRSAQWRQMEAGSPHTGWIAVSETSFQLDHPGYTWLDGLPYTRVGRSIRLYHIPPGP